MKQWIDSIWLAIEKAKEVYSQFEDVDIDTSSEKRVSFEKHFCESYKNIKRKYMKKDVISLDRHKVAAIIICTIIEEKIVTTKRENLSDVIFLGSEMIALSIGLSYMEQSLNSLLFKANIPKSITGYYMPTALACKTDYFDILARNLYFSRTDYMLNPLDLADKLFLLEYLTLRNEYIDPQLIINMTSQKED